MSQTFKSDGIGFEKRSKNINYVRGIERMLGFLLASLSIYLHSLKCWGIQVGREWSWLMMGRGLKWLRENREIEKRGKRELGEESRLEKETETHSNVPFNLLYFLRYFTLSKHAQSIPLQLLSLLTQHPISYD